MTFRVKPRSAGPYWLNAANYYVLSVAIALTIFVLVLGVLRDEYEEAYIAAGIAASGVMICAVVIRIAILKKYQMRTLAARKLDHNLSLVLLLTAEAPKKLSIEKNASILRELKRKSEAALILARHPEGHREVFELCDQYLELNAREMLRVNAGSPRIAALRRGREIAEDYHRRHMLRWAELETTDRFAKAQKAAKNAEKMALAGEAMAVLKVASNKYPTERQVIDSESAISEFLLKLKLSDHIDRAARAEQRGNIKSAVRSLRMALKEIGESEIPAADREAATVRINTELRRLNQEI